VDGAEIGSAAQACNHGSTNNEAECMGAASAFCLLKALLAAVMAGQVDLPLPTEIRVYGDSQLIINQAQALWKVHAKNSIEPIAELRKLSWELHTAVRGSSAPAIPRVRLQWAHIRRESNKRADRLSNLAMDAVHHPVSAPFSAVRMFEPSRLPALAGLANGKAAVALVSNAAAAQRFIK